MALFHNLKSVSFNKFYIPNFSLSNSRGIIRFSKTWKSCLADFALYQYGSYQSISTEFQMYSSLHFSLLHEEVDDRQLCPLLFQRPKKACSHQNLILKFSSGSQYSTSLSCRICFFAGELFYYVKNQIQNC
jgi:hypothetical protein